MIKQSGVILVIFISIVSCKGQTSTNDSTKLKDPYFVVVKDTIANHGPQNITRNVLQDRKGNIWFASWEGIIKYDGKQFINHTLKSGLRQWHCFSILEDKVGNLWFGSIGGGAYKYDGKSFILFNTDNGLGNDIIECMLQDMDGNIWFGTHGGLTKYDGQSFSYYTVKDGLASNYIHGMEQDKTGKLWIATEAGINIYQPSGMIWTAGKTFIDFKNESGIAFSNVRGILEDKNGNIWIGSNDGLAMYDGKTITTLRSNFVGNLFEDRKGNLWFSEGARSSMSLIKFDGITYTSVASERQVFGITEDTKGNILFGTEMGVYKYNGKEITHQIP